MLYTRSTLCTPSVGCLTTTWPCHRAAASGISEVSVSTTFARPPAGIPISNSSPAWASPGSVPSPIRIQYIGQSPAPQVEGRHTPRRQLKPSPAQSSSWEHTHPGPSHRHSSGLASSHAQLGWVSGSHAIAPSRARFAVSEEPSANCIRCRFLLTTKVWKVGVLL